MGRLLVADFHLGPWLIADYFDGGCVSLGAVVSGVAGLSRVGRPPGFHCGFQVESASQRMGLSMEAIALVIWVKSMVLSSSLGWW